MIHGVEPPRDAEGREIPLSTDALYHLDGEMVEVYSFNYWPEYKEWHVKWSSDRLIDSDLTSEFLLSPPDSWEKLEKDVYSLVMSEYLDAPEEDVKDIMSRAKALAEREKR